MKARSPHSIAQADLISAPCLSTSDAWLRMVDEKIPSFNFDIAEGVSYRLNLSKPNGSRIENREFKGKPLAPTQKLRLVSFPRNKSHYSRSDRKIMLHLTNAQCPLELPQIFRAGILPVAAWMTAIQRGISTEETGRMPAPPEH